jgi:hypothetical protein
MSGWSQDLKQLHSGVQLTTSGVLRPSRFEKRTRTIPLHRAAGTKSSSDDAVALEKVLSSLDKLQFTPVLRRGERKCSASPIWIARCSFDMDVDSSTRHHHTTKCVFRGSVSVEYFTY